MSVKFYIFVVLNFIVLIAISCASNFQINQKPTISNETPAAQKSAVPGEAVKMENQVRQDSSAENSRAETKFDACAVISKSEIETVQGETVKEAKSSSRISGSLMVSQCFYQLATYSKSVSLEITQNNPDNQKKYNLRDFWKQKFNTRTIADDDREPEHDRDSRSAEKKADEKESSNQPQAVQKLGDAAFRVGNRITGALYVLRKNTIIRISIGGAEDEATKMKKLRILAQKALKRV